MVLFFIFYVYEFDYDFRGYDFVLRSFYKLLSCVLVVSYYPCYDSPSFNYPPSNPCPSDVFDNIVCHISISFLLHLKQFLDQSKCENLVAKGYEIDAVSLFNLWKSLCNSKELYLNTNQMIEHWIKNSHHKSIHEDLSCPSVLA